MCVPRRVRSRTQFVVCVSAGLPPTKTARGLDIFMYAWGQQQYVAANRQATAVKTRGSCNPLGRLGALTLLARANFSCFVFRIWMTPTRNRTVTPRFDILSRCEISPPGTNRTRALKTANPPLARSRYRKDAQVLVPAEPGQSRPPQCSSVTWSSLIVSRALFC